jgi:Flp pilus assembly protein protease CpaA
MLSCLIVFHPFLLTFFLLTFFLLTFLLVVILLALSASRNLTRSPTATYLLLQASSVSYAARVAATTPLIAGSHGVRWLRWRF